jgi:diaminohydroxyphosphoribosylaminopyrimidine deaminase / 5-amino-6-(5-phosphoribosylamino)uracil reductase
MRGKQFAESPSGRSFMEQAIEEMAKSQGKGPKVGAMVVVDGKVVAVAHRLSGIHAERAAIEAAQAISVDLKGATIYTTLEPCVSIGSSHETKESCADLISRVGISTVVVGRYDPNPNIYRKGWKVLRDAGVTLRDFESDLRERLDDLNALFVGHFESGTGPTGGAKFDYMLNDGDFEIAYSAVDQRSIVTRWTMAGTRAIYAYARHPLKVALAKYANEFSEIDDPTALDFSHSVRVEEGEIAAFIGTTGCALVKVLEVHSGPRYGSDHTSVKVQYEVRLL